MYHSTQSTAVVLQPTTYNLSIKSDYDELINEIRIKTFQSKDFKIEGRIRQYDT